MLLEKYLYAFPDGKENQLTVEDPNTQYGKFILMKVRLGQGAFRVLA